MKEYSVDTWGESMPGSRNSKCRGSDIGLSGEEQWEQGGLWGWSRESESKQAGGEIRVGADGEGPCRLY